jgi:hypothetical protein
MISVSLYSGRRKRGTHSWNVIQHLVSGQNIINALPWPLPSTLFHLLVLPNSLAKNLFAPGGQQIAHEGMSIRIHVPKVTSAVVRHEPVFVEIFEGEVLSRRLVSRVRSEWGGDEGRVGEDVGEEQVSQGDDGGVVVGCNCSVQVATCGDAFERERHYLD